MTVEAATLTGTQKAALVLLQLGRDQTAAVLSSMGDDEIETLMSEIARMGRVPDEVVQQVMAEFAQATSTTGSATGGMGFVRDVLNRGMDPNRAEALLERIQDPVQPFSFVLGADRRQVVTFLCEEHPQTAALVLIHLPAGTAADLLGQLPQQLQGDVARRVATLERPSPTVIRLVEAELEQKLTATSRGPTPSPEGGVTPLVNILNRAEPSTEARVLELLDNLAPDLSEEVRRHLFVFADIVKLDDRAVQLIMREVVTADLAMALKGASEEVKGKIMRNLSERAATNLTEEMDLLGPVRMQQVEEARDTVIKAIRSLEEAGSLVVGRGSDDLVV
jgi:flagellar motor switch protein FliG